MELKIQGLSKTYRNGVQVLKNVDLEISNGMFGLLGPNGAGKSTLMRTIASLQDADKGSIQLNGLNVLKDKHKIRRILGYLPQEFGLYPEMTAEQMLNQIAVLKGILNKKHRRESIEIILEQTNLADLKKRKLGGFSGGMKQRFGIAQALIGSPRLIIVDEPTAGLDPEERNRFHNLLSSLSEDIIVILSTHIVDDVQQLCSQLAVIHSGEILLTGRTDEIMKMLQGRLWEKVVLKNELAEYDDKYNIIFTRLFTGSVIIHVLNDHRPDDSFSPAEPDLEDVYFSVIQSRAIEGQKTGGIHV